MFTLRLFQIKKHSRRVTIFKRGLPVFAFLWASLMLIWPIMFAEQKEQFATAVHSGKVGSAKVDMEDVRFYAQDKKKQPLTVTAPKVLETDHENQLITLYKPVATYLLSSGVTLTAVTSHGVVDQVNELMTFENEVTTTTDNGYRALSSQVICHNREGTLDSESPVFITGPAGQLKATGFHVSDKGNNILFTGRTDTTINNADGQIYVHSEDGLLIEQIPQKITATQDVKVTQQAHVITADRMVLTYFTKEQNPDSRIQKIEAFGHVIATSEGRKITGDRGIYDPQKEEIVMSDNVVLYQGDSHMAGQTARLNLKTGESNLVPLSNTPDTKQNRVRGRLVPADFKGESK